MKTYTSGLIIKENTKITKTRLLPIKGEILCNIGDKVDFNTVIGKSEIKGNLFTYPFAKELGINPKDINKYLLCKINDTVEKGQVLGEISSFFNIFKNKVYSPFEGVIEYINEDTGNIGIRLKSTILELNSYIKGTIEEIIPQEGVKISTYGTYMQGIFGIGSEKQGKLIVLEDINTSENNLKDTIVVYNNKTDFDFLHKLEKLGVIGLITGSISDITLKEYINTDLGVAITGHEKTKLTIILTEGFGNIPINNKTYNILKKINNKFVSINGQTQIRAGVIRPEIIQVNSDTQQTEELNENELKIGSKVRIISEPYLCQYGTVTNIFDKPITLETNATVNCVEIDISKKKVVIPRTNIELILE